MALWDKILAEFIDIIEWIDQSNDTMCWRFPRYNNEIKYNAKLIVREGQMAVFVNEGQLADIFTPGTYTLDTRNLPVLATLKGWKYGFESPFKAEVYFCSTRQFTNLKWGTPGPSIMRDAEFGAIRITAFGLYAIRVSDPALFIRELAGTEGTFSTDEIKDNLKGKIGTRIKELIPELQIPAMELESKVFTLGELLKAQIAPSFEEFGITLQEIQVQNIGLPEEVEKAIDKAGAMRVIGNMQSYTQYEAASSIRDAANNPGGLAAAGAGAGLGLGIGSQVSTAVGGQLAAGQTNNTNSVIPPTLPQHTFYLAINGQQAGPFNQPALQQMALNGQLTRETLVWMQGMPQWDAATTVPELAEILAAVPPPLTTT